jgi:hypothetical protein
MKISSAEPMDGCRLRISFDDGSRLILDLSLKMRTTRFRQLAEPGVFGRAQADGERVYWSELAELTVDELLELARTEGKVTGGSRSE